MDLVSSPLVRALCICKGREYSQREQSEFVSSRMHQCRCVQLYNTVERLGGVEEHSRCE